MPRPKSTATVCSVPGCGQPRYGNSLLCKDHFNARRRERAAHKPDRTVCSVPGCGQPRKPGRAQCAEHYREKDRLRKRRTGLQHGLDARTKMQRLIDENGVPFAAVKPPAAMTEKHRRLLEWLEENFGWRIEDVS